MKLLHTVYSTILLLTTAFAYVAVPAASWPDDAPLPETAAPGQEETRTSPEGEGGEEPYHVEADVTEGYYTAGDQVLHGIGHVVIVHSGTTITCDEAYSYEAQNLATLLGNVKIKNDVEKYTLTSGYAEYRRDEKLSIATKTPRLVIERERPITITSDIMRMWSDEDYGEAAGDVKVVSEDVEGYGQKLKYFGKEDRIELSGKPVVHQGDSRLAGDVITLFLREEKLDRALAEGSARILYFSRNEEEGEGEIAAGGEGQTEGGEPVKDEASGESAGESAVSVVATESVPPVGEEAGPAEAPSEQPAAEEGTEEEKPPSGRVEASGDTMEGFFTDGVLERVDVAGDAEGHYWPFDEFGRETGEKVDAAGDLIRITMNGGEVKKIVVEGNAEGVYRPAKSEGRSGVTKTAGDRISVFVTAREVRRIVVFGRARGSYFTEETPAIKEGEGSGG
jgi:lipopolysaccharide export system protein LptA